MTSQSKSNIKKQLQKFRQKYQATNDAEYKRQLAWSIKELKKRVGRANG